jgi:hypothetical protein
MKDTTFIEILPYDEVEILGEEPLLPNSRYRVVGLSRSRNLVAVELRDSGGRVSKTIDCPPHRVKVHLLACDPRAGAKISSDSGPEETKHFVSVYEAFVKKRTGDFDEWRAQEQGV